MLIKAEQWVAYTQLENEAQSRAGVEAIFNKTLTKLPSLQLWSAYLDHIRRHYNVAADKTASQVIHAAYEAVINAVGIDKDAGKIWQDYVQFIKSGPGVLGGSNWQDQQKMDLLRKVYQRAICIPTQAVESLWREYNGFEMSLNKLTVRESCGSCLAQHKLTVYPGPQIPTGSITCVYDRSQLPHGITRY